MAQHKSCRADYQHRYWQEHKEEKRAYRRRGNRARKLRVLEHYSQGGIPRCANCKETDTDVLTINHMNNDGAEQRQIYGRGSNFYRWLEKTGYPEGFQTLCFNCNWKRRMKETEVDNAC